MVTKKGLFWGIICFFFLPVASAQDSVVFREDFDTNVLGWDEVEDPAYGSRVEEGVYRIYLNKTQGGWQINKNFFIDPEHDFCIEAAVTQENGMNDQGYGLIWGGAGSDNSFYAFLVCSNGMFIVFEYAGKYVSLKDWTRHQSIRPAGKSNVLSICRSGNLWNFSVNGQQVYQCASRSFHGNYLGFMVNGTMQIAADYLMIRQDGVSPFLIDRPINGYKKENLGPSINSPYEEVMPVISADGKTLYVSRYHPENTGGISDCDIWYSVLENGRWAPLKNIGQPLNNMGGNAVISVSPDGNTLLLMNTYNPDGSAGHEGISLSRRTASGWSLPENITIRNYVNQNMYSSFFLSADNLTLLMGIQGEDTRGGQDLYVSFRTDSGFSHPLNLGNTINTFGDEITPFLAPDNVTLYFASDGRPGYGSCDIFVSKRLDDTWIHWSEPQNLGPEINTAGWDAYYSLPASGDVAYVVSSDQSFGKSDVFKITIPESARPRPVVLVYGKVLNSKTKSPLSAEIVFSDLSTGKMLGKALSSPVDGTYRIVLPYGKKYSFLATKENFYSVGENLDLTKINRYQELERDLFLSPVEAGEIIRLNNIFFETNKSELKPESYAELDRLVTLLKKNPSMQIEIRGHTDSDGDDNYNRQLSEARAKAVYNYLVYKKIDPSRLKSKGYGETSPVAPNTTAKGKALNRRVEFFIVKK